MPRADRLYRILLRLYPAEFRGEYGREMTQLFRDRARHEPLLRVWLDVVRDLVVTVPREQAHVLMNDLRYALRTIRRTPAFSAAVMLTVALAIAANTAMFTVVNAVLLRPLPFADPHRLVQVAEKNDRLNLPNFGASVLNFVSWRQETRAFDELAAIGFTSFNLSGQGEPEQFVGNRISPALLNVLGIAPVAGRGFSDAEEKPGAAVAMIGERLWARRFGRDPSLVGRVITLNSTPVTVVGIAPAALNLFSAGDIYVPLTIDRAKEIRLNHVIFVAGRLKPGVTLQQAQAECDTIAAGMARTYPEMRDWGIHLLTFFETFVAPQLETALLVLLAAVGFVLLIACANIANLLLATVRTMEEWVSSSATQPRLSAALVGVFASVAVLIAAIGIYGVLAYSVNQRTREIGLRIALGARADGVVRLVVKEGMGVALAGIGAGVATAVALGQGISSLVYGIAPRDPLTFAGVAALLALVALAACSVPARRASRVDPIVALREE